MNQDKFEVLQTAVEYTQRLYTGIMSAAECYRGGKVGEGYQYITMITHGIEWLVDVIGLTQDVLVNGLDTTKINELGEELIEAMENEDSVLIADLLEYEMAEEIESWQGILTETVSRFAAEMCHEA